MACGDYLLVFGGWSADGSAPLAHPELLHLETRCWTHCSTVNEPPPARGNPTLVYSRRRHLALLFGGWNRRERLGDAWCLDMESWRCATTENEPKTLVGARFCMYFLFEFPYFLLILKIKYTDC